MTWRASMMICATCKVEAEACVCEATYVCAMGCEGAFQQPLSNMCRSSLWVSVASTCQVSQ